MRFEAPLLSATFLARPNRFLGVVDLGGATTNCFIPDPGRLEDLLKPSSRVYLTTRESATRKTSYDMVLVELGDLLVSTDSRVPNMVFQESLNTGALTALRGFRVEKREPIFGESRLDFTMTNGSVTLLLEVKSCTLVKDGVALFPDAPTSRGVRQLNDLMKWLFLGRAAVFFLIQRRDAEALRPFHGRDPKFARALKEAAEMGVEVYAYNSDVTLEGISVKKSVQIIL